MRQQQATATDATTADASRDASGSGWCGKRCIGFGYRNNNLNERV
jgi:hypothetical protein